MPRFYLGLAYMQDNKVDLAESTMNEAVRIDSLLAEVYFSQTNYPKAEESFRKVISIEPNNGDAYGYLGQVYAAQNSVDKAIQEFENALKVNPRSTGAHIILGSLHQMRNSTDQA